MPRLILDISTVARWVGAPVGIVRVEYELAQHAMRHRQDVQLTFYDPLTESLRALQPAWQELVLGLDGAIDTIGIDFRRHRPRWRNMLSPRYPVVMRLEHLRLSGPASTRALAERIQGWLLGADARRTPFTDRFERRMAVVAYRFALGAEVQPGPDDTLLSAGSDWLHKGTAMLSLRARYGFRMTVMCYDLLPLTHPEFFPPEELPGFAAYWDATLRAGVRVLCNSASIAQDLRTHAARLGAPDPEPVIVPLAATSNSDAPLPPLRPPLQPGRFAMFVSTVEPRKGHGVLLEAWSRLLRQGIPQRHNFRLLFVGRRGWMVDDVLDRLAVARSEPYGALHWEGVSDRELERLYRDCAFCLYPSRYEGFGLPIIEAFTRGKAVIASDGGAVRETVADLSPSLDPLAVDAWTSRMADWIEHPAAREVWEARIRQRFRPRHWPDVAEQIMTAAVS